MFNEIVCANWNGMQCKTPTSFQKQAEPQHWQFYWHVNGHFKDHEIAHDYEKIDMLCHLLDVAVVSNEHKDT